MYLKPISILALLLLIVSCKPSKIVDSKGRLRILNASSNAGDINLKVDYETIYASNVQFLNYSLFREYIANKKKIQITNSSNSVIIDTAMTIVENKSYTIYIYDSLNNINIKFLQEDFIPPTGSNCKVRFLNFGKDADVVDVYKTTDNSVQFLNYANGAHSDFVSILSGYTQFDVYYAGTTNLMYNYYGSDLKPGAFYTVFLKGTKTSMGTDSLGIYTIENHLNY